MKIRPCFALTLVMFSIALVLSCTDRKPVQSPVAKVRDTNAVVAALIDSATRVRTRAYAPYSRFLAGSAVLGESGKIYTGCNVENASYGLTTCAERSAIFNAVSAGEKHIKAISIVSDVPEFDAPCGACRQVIYEFGSDVDVIMANLKGNRKVEKITKLLPYAFGPESL